jgi:hypothetical protein
MSSPRGDAMKSQLGWKVSLHYRRGARQRLRGIDLYYDFPWAAHFHDRRAQFANGQCLADQVIEDCPTGKRPALLLTDRDDVEEGARETERSYVVVLNLPRYLESAGGNAAATYLAQRLGRGITRARSFTHVPEASADDLAQWLGERLNRDVLARWAGDNIERRRLLHTFGTPDDVDESVNDAARALAAIKVLGELDPEIAKAIGELVTSETDHAARVELLRALTGDIEGRYVTGEILHERAQERLTDARDAAKHFDNLLKKEGETELQGFLELHPWLLGLDYAQIRARQPIPRGAVDFLLERFDGFHDLMELKSPGDAIFEIHGKETGVPSPSSYRLSRPLALALAQVHAYRDALHYESVHEDLYGLSHTREPRIIILIGRASQLTQHQERLLREFNRSLHRVEVMPFDVLGRRARAILDNVEHYLLAADEEAGSK